MSLTKKGSLTDNDAPSPKDSHKKLDLTRSESSPQPGSNNESKERRKLIGRIWSILPVPLRSDFFILYFDTQNHQELKKRVKIVEDVLFDFLSPLADTFSRTERGIYGPDTDRVGQGQIKVPIEDFRCLYSYWSDSAIDWDNIRSEIIERILSVPEHKQNPYKYHGRGGHTGYNTSSMDSISSPMSPMSLRKETIILTKSPRPDAPWSRRKYPKSSKCVDSDIDGDRLEDHHQFNHPWQSHAISYLKYEDFKTHDFAQPMRYFPLVGDHKQYGRKDSTVDSLKQKYEGSQKKAGAWTRRNNSSFKSSPSFFYTSEGLQQREGTQRLKMMLKKAKYIERNYSPSKVVAVKESTSGNEMITDRLFKNPGPHFWKMLKWGNVKVAGQILRKLGNDGTVYDRNYGTPFVLWLLGFLSKKNSDDKIEDYQTILNDLPDEIMATSAQTVPKDCVFKFESAALSNSQDPCALTRPSIFVSECKPIDVMMMIIEEYRCDECNVIRERAIQVVDFLMKKEYPQMDISELVYPDIVSSCKPGNCQ